MTDAGGTWTDERVEMLKKLWSEGLSASQIAAEIGSVTRNAVIGKVHRLGLSGRGKAKSSSHQRVKKPVRTPSVPGAIAEQAPRSTGAIAPLPLAMEPESVAATDDVVVPMSERVTIMDLRESMCRWPMGDPTKAEFRFCGGRSVTGLPYCAHHSRIAYQPVADRKRDRRFARA
ncbi:MAG TPA: GcrA family cell cycle regulator [Microvirga sp.]|jgi:GcrA cell cycle regulator|nr:GcrA family cell cycle regulator [Microvirga sp.]